MKLAWLTDIHLNFVGFGDRQALLDSLIGVCDAVVVTGDLGESPSIVGFLTEMELSLQMPSYFVLGNHDFYRGSIASTREAVARLAAGRIVPAMGVSHLCLRANSQTGSGCELTALCRQTIAKSRDRFVHILFI